MVIVEFLLSLLALSLAISAWKGEIIRWKEAYELKKTSNRYYHEDDEGDGNGWD